MALRTELVYACGMSDLVANNVRAERDKRGLTQEELAQAVGVSRQTIISIEKGKYVPSVALAIRIARFFKVPVESLFTIS